MLWFFEHHLANVLHQLFAFYSRFAYVDFKLIMVLFSCNDYSNRWSYYAGPQA